MVGDLITVFKCKKCCTEDDDPFFSLSTEERTRSKEVYPGIRMDTRTNFLIIRTVKN